MDKISDARRFELVELAESSSPLPSDLGSEELEIIKQFRSVICAISKPLESANPSAIAMAEAVMANERSRVVRASLVTPNAVSSYARGAHPQQLEFQAETVVIRLMLQTDENGHSVMGRMNEPGWQVSADGKSTVCDASGRFELASSEPRLSLSKGDKTIELVLPSDIDAAD